MPNEVKSTESVYRVTEVIAIAVQFTDNSAATRQASSVRTDESPNLQTSLTIASSRDSVG
jgi:hypothetical protein